MIRLSHRLRLKFKNNLASLSCLSQPKKAVYIASVGGSLLYESDMMKPALVGS